MINSRNINDLHPKVAWLCLNLIDKCKQEGIDLLITSTYRDFEAQKALYAQGRTTPGRKVTRAKAGQSFHNYKVAFDFVPIVYGKAQWNDKALFNRIGIMGENLGLTWAGRWTEFPESVHFQLTNGLTIEDFQAGKTL